MQKLRTVKDLDVSGKRVLVRADLDVVDDYSRIEAGKETLQYLVDNKAKTIIIGHKGRPGGKVVEELSLKPLTEVIRNIIGRDVKFVNKVVGEKVSKEIEKLKEGDVAMLENLRFDKRESFDPAQDAGAEEFAKKLASYAQVYVNECFSTCHRSHASFMGLPKYLPHAAGFRLQKEIETLSHVTEDTDRPLIFLISGIKKDKVEMIRDITEIADKILVAGRLPEYITEEDELRENGKVVIARLNPDKEDVTMNSVEAFRKEIQNARTIVLAGVVGKYEDKGQRQGTKKVFKEVANSSAYKVAGGGDTEAALTMFGLTSKFNWISVGGGAMLQYLAKGTLPAIDALLN